MNYTERLQAYLRENEVPFQIQHHPMAYSAQEVAASEHVPGKVMAATNAEPAVNFDDCWKRSLDNIRQVLPHAKAQGIKIAIENVWNDFLTTPEQFVKYLDEV